MRTDTRYFGYYPCMTCTLIFSLKNLGKNMHIIHSKIQYYEYITKCTGCIGFIKFPIIDESSKYNLLMFILHTDLCISCLLKAGMDRSTHKFLSHPTVKHTAVNWHLLNSIMLYRSLWSCFRVKNFPVLLWNKIQWKQYCVSFTQLWESKWQLKTK